MPEMHDMIEMAANGLEWLQRAGNGCKWLIMAAKSLKWFFKTKLGMGTIKNPSSFYY